jgi:hypothetical protein
VNVGASATPESSRTSNAVLDGKKCLEAGEGNLLYRRNGLVAPEDIDELVRTGLEIYSLLSRPTSDNQAPADYSKD